MFLYRVVVEYSFAAKFTAHCTLQELTSVGFGSGLWNTGLEQSLSAH